MAVKTVEHEDTQKELAARRTHVRDEDQLAIDGWTKELTAEFDTAGRPGEEDYAGPTRRFATDDAPDGKRRVARAFALVNHDRDGGESAPKLAALWFKNSKPDADGYVTIKYGVRIATAKDKAEEAAAEKTAEPSGDQADQGNGDQPNADTPPFDEGSGDQEQHGRRGRLHRER